jgi:hypothetical protein
MATPKTLATLALQKRIEDMVSPEKRMLTDPLHPELLELLEDIEELERFTFAATGVVFEQRDSEFRGPTSEELDMFYQLGFKIGDLPSSAFEFKLYEGSPTVARIERYIYDECVVIRVDSTEIASFWLSVPVPLEGVHAVINGLPEYHFNGLKGRAYGHMVSRTTVCLDLRARRQLKTTTPDQAKLCNYNAVDKSVTVQVKSSDVPDFYVEFVIMLDTLAQFIAEATM